LFADLIHQCRGHIKQGMHAPGAGQAVVGVKMDFAVRKNVNVGTDGIKTELLSLEYRDQKTHEKHDNVRNKKRS